MGKNLQSKMLIFHICSWYPNRVILNDGNFIQKHIRSLNKYVDSIVLSVYEDSDLKSGYQLIESQDEGIKAYIYYISQSKNKFLKIFKRFLFYFKGYKLLKKKYGKPDILHAHVFLFGGIFSWLLSFFEKTPYIVSEHSNIYSNKIPIFKKILVRKSAKKSKYIFPVSRNLQSKLLKMNINGNYLIIPNVVDCNIFKPIIKNSNSVFQFLHISNFAVEKNIPGLLKAIKKLSEQRSDYHFTIAGDGELSEVKKLINNHEIDYKFLSIKGKLSENEVALNMQNSDCFVLFSDDENLPCVILEAISSGLPVISTNVGGIIEILNDEKLGVLIEPQDVTALLKALNYVIDNKLKYNKTYISNFGRNNFSEELVGNQIFNIYKEILST